MGISRTSARYLGLLALAIVLYHWKTLLTDQFTSIVGWEGVSQSYAWLHFWVNSVWHGHLPLWDPYTFGGRPFSGEMQTAAFYPFRLLFALVPLNRNGLISPRFYQEYLAFTQFLAGGCMFGLLRELRRSHFAAFLGACAFAMGGLLPRLPWPHYMESCVWLPAVLFFFLRALRAESRQRALAESALAGLCMGMTALTGGVQFSMMDGIVVVTAAIYYGVGTTATPDRPFADRANWFRLASIVAMIFVIAFCTGAAQLFPATEYSHLSLRSINGGFYPMADKIPYDRMDRGMWPQSILTGVIPAGGPLGGGEAWPYYIGVFPMLLAVIAIWKCRKTLWIRYLLGLALLTFVYILGEYSPLNGLLYAVVPYLWMIREPARFIYLISFSLTVLAAFGMDCVFDGVGQSDLWAPARPYLRWISLACVAAIVVPGVFTQIAFGIWPCLSLLLILGAFLWFMRLTSRPASAAMRVALMAFIVFDLTLFNWSEANRNTMPKTSDSYTQMLTLRSAAAFVKAQPGINRMRVPIDGEPNVGDIYGLQSLWGGGATLLNSYAKLNPREDLLNVRYRIRPAATPDPGAIYQDIFWKVYEDTNAFPRAWVTHQTTVEPSDDAVYKLIEKKSLDLHNVGIVAASLPTALDAAATGDTVRFRSYQADSMSLDVNAAGAGLLILSEFYYPGWHATVNGKGAEIHKVDGGLRGIVVPRGASQVALEYSPLRSYIGVSLSLLTMIGVLVTGVLILRRGL